MSLKKQFSRFLVVGVLNTLLGYAVIFACMYLIDLSPELSNVAGYAVGLILSYVLNKFYTFESTNKSPKEIVRFLAVFAIAYGANFIALNIFIYQMGFYKGLSQILAGVIYIAASFLLNKFYVFGTEKT